MFENEILTPLARFIRSWMGSFSIFIACENLIPFSVILLLGDWCMIRSCFRVFLDLRLPPLGHSTSPYSPEYVWSSKFQNSQGKGKKHWNNRIQTSGWFRSDVWILSYVKAQNYHTKQTSETQTFRRLFWCENTLKTLGRETRRLNQNKADVCFCSEIYSIPCAQFQTSVLVSLDVWILDTLFY